MASLKIYFSNLNIYEASTDLTTDEEKDHERQLNIISTRIFLIFLIVSLISMGVIFKALGNNVLIKIDNPTEEQFKSFPSDANCPCSHVSLFYKEFVLVETRFHQICSSEFISDRWIKAIYSGVFATYFYYNDFRTDASAAFQALESFCRLSKDYVNQSIEAFYADLFISQKVFTEVDLQVQINALIEQFQLSISNEFLRQIQLIRGMTQGNFFLNVLQTGFMQLYHYINTNQFQLLLKNIEFSTGQGTICGCNKDVDCYTKSKISDVFAQPTQVNLPFPWKELMDISGFVRGCYPVDTILFSTFECFYNQSCLNKLLSSFPTNENFTSLNSLELIKFKTNSTMKTIIEDLMVEQWVKNISYEKYYKSCAVSSCTYFKYERYDWLFVLTKLISSLAGLVMILSFIIQKIIQWLLRRPTQNSEPTSLLIKIKRLLKNALVQLNLYQHNESSEQQIKYQRIATIFYIIALLISLLVLSLQVAFTENVYQKTISQPSEFQYKQLESIYSSNIHCPCSLISMNYLTFTTIQPSYHQICSDNFLSQQWFDYLRQLVRIDQFYGVSDYRYGSLRQFQFLQTFCDQSKQTVETSLKTFLQTKLVSSQILSEEHFLSRINLFIFNWRNQTLKRFLRTIQLFRSINHGNQLWSGWSNIDSDITNTINEIITIGIREYSNCSCGLSSSCKNNFVIYNDARTTENPSSIVMTIPNFFLGCFRTEGLMQSTLECFYNRSCMLEIDKHAPNPLNASFNFSVLNENLNSPYETIESIINNLMVDSWLTNISYSLYYSTCSPLSCSYEYTGRNDLFTVITIVIGLFGGLSLGLKLGILIILRFIEKIKNNVSFNGFKNVLQNFFVFNTEQKQINRLHLLLLLLILYGIFPIVTFTPNLINVQIKKPSISAYKQLLNSYSNTLQCSCSQMSISYESFFSIEPRFHELCSSKFVSNEWISYLYGQGNLYLRFSPYDYRSSAPGQFVLLSKYCNLSQQAVNDAIDQLLSSYFISSQLLTENDLNQQIRIIFNQFKSATANSFINIFNLIRQIIGSNKISSGWGTNWNYASDGSVNDAWTAHSKHLKYDQCDCGLSSKCTQSSRGMMTGCYALESILQTKLRCFYDQNCIDSNGTFNKLNISTLEKSQFHLDSTIESILNHLMIEEYKYYLSYEHYFNQCLPLTCSYYYTKTYDIIQPFIYFTSLYGGLFIITQCLAIIFVKIYQTYKTNRVDPEQIQQNNSSNINQQSVRIAWLDLTINNR